MSANLREMVSAANMNRFREQFSIPEDVKIKLLPRDANLNKLDGDGIIFPLLAIPEGGVRFPLSPLIREVLAFWGLCPRQGTGNFYRVLSSIEALNRLLGLRLGFSAVRHCYMLSPFPA